MAVTHIEIRSRRPFAGGAPFGAAGVYERVDGTVHYAVDPAHPLNEGIVDLDRAPRDADGRVRFQGDFCVVQPVDPTRANGNLLYEVANRGRRGALSRFSGAAPKGSPAPNDGGPDENTGAIAYGNGSLLQQGWTAAWCGWQWDVPRESRLIRFEAPQAVDGGTPIQGQILVQFQPDAAMPDHLLADRVHHPYPAADVDDPAATLTVREWLDGPGTTIPRSQWRFARVGDGRPVADDTFVWLEGGFVPGRIYEVHYRTRICPVVGTGLLAVRDFVSFLRYASEADGNPCAGRVNATFGYGSSQSGRFLREYVRVGLNVDERERRVFDGLYINVAGARRGEFNVRYGQPSVILTRNLGHLPPFGFEDEPDGPDGTGGNTGTREGLLHRLRSRGGVPKIMAVNTSAEYWNRDASLLHTDARGTRDVALPDDVRVYHFAGTKHGPGGLPGASRRADGLPPQIENVLDFGPLLRAALFNLERWVNEGVEPPPSAHARLADGTASRPAEVLGAFRRLPGVRVPDPAHLPWNRVLDLGPDAARGVARQPAHGGDQYVTYLSALDADGNEVAGVRLPDLAAPVATHTGWFPRRPGTGGEDLNVDMIGSTMPFAPTEDARRRADDPRPSIAARYPTRAAYETLIRAAAARLVEQRYLLAEDEDLAVENALARYDLFAAVPS
jgi:hypothetical protein